MIDVWVTIGTMVADKNLLDGVLVTLESAPQPVYKKFGTSLTIGNPGGKYPDPDEQTLINEQGGVYEEKATVLMKAALEDFFYKSYPHLRIPVSTYCAGLLCKLAAATPAKGKKSFLEALEGHQKRYAALADPPQAPLSREYLAALGLALIDTEVRGKIDNNDLNDLFKRLYFTDATEKHVNALREIVAPLMKPGGDDILSGPHWGSCLQVFDYYDGFRFAIG